MNRKSFLRRLTGGALLALGFGLVFGLNSNSEEIIKDQVKKANDTTAEDLKNYDDYLGYGYDVTAGALYDTKKVFRNVTPILDVNNANLKSKIRLIDSGAKTQYNKYSTDSRREMTQHYGKEISGGAAIDAKIQAINVNLNASFDMSNGISSGEIQSENFSYYNLVADKVSVLYQLDSSDGGFSNYLSQNFTNDVKKVDTLDAANQLMKKYGTHLLTGYSMGGVLEITNHYAQTDSEYNKESQNDFIGQMGATFDSAVSGSLEADFSFSATYGLADNNKYAVNKYKANQYGGNAITGLSIDQLFKWRDPALGKQEYVYQDWVDSINDGKGLVIVDIPGGAEAIPLYQLLPNTSEYSTARSMLLQKYLAICSEKYSTYLSNTIDIGINDITNPTINENNPSIKISGANFYLPASGNLYQNSYVSNDGKDNEMKVSARSGQTVSLDYSVSNLDGYSYEWWADSDIRDQLSLDSKTGTFTVKNDMTSAKEGKIYCRLSDANKVTLATVVVTIGDSSFGGGDGSENNPYLISTKEHFNELCKNSQNDNYNGKYFKLINDIDFGNSELLTRVGNDKCLFNGKFDGNYHTIFNWKISSVNNKNYIGLFNALGGASEITNLRVHGGNISISDDSYDRENLSVGLLAGKSSGTINGCYIDDSTIQLNLHGEDSLNVKRVNAGGLVGQFDGNSISSCQLKGNSVSLQGYSIQKASVGGVVGYHEEGTSSVTNCSVKDFKNLKSVTNLDKLACTNDDLGKTENSLRRIETYAGGIIGECNSGTSVNNSLVENTTVYAENTSKEKKIKNLSGKEIGSNFIIAHMFTHAGGFIGFVDKGAQNNGNIFSNDVFNKGGLTAKNGLDQHEYVYGVAPYEYYGQTGFLVGREQNDSNTTNKITSKISTSNIFLVNQNSNVTYVGNATKTPNIVCVFSIEDFTTINSSFIKNDNKIDIKFKWPVSVSFTDRDGFTLEDSTLIKKNFFLGEDFTVGSDIKAEVKFGGEGKENGKESTVTLKDYFINYSNFDKTKEGDYTITVQTSFDGTICASSYKVQVEKANLNTSLVVKKKQGTDTKKYYVGDPTPKDTVSVLAVYSDSTSKSIALDDPKLKISADNDTLKIGQNRVTYTYTSDDGAKATGYVVYEAEEREIKDFTIIDKPTKTEYTSVNSIVLLSGLKIRVSYKNDEATQDIAYDDYKDDFEVYHVPLHYGTDNIVNVCYYDYNYKTFNVAVVSSEMTENVNEFIRLVNSCGDTSDDAERAKLISQCIDLKSKISGIVGNDEYDDACKKLEQLKKEYDSYVVVQLSEFRSIVNDCKNTTSMGDLSKLIDSAKQKKESLSFLSDNVDYKAICDDLTAVIVKYNSAINSALNEWKTLIANCETKQALAEWKAILEQAFAKKKELSYLADNSTYQELSDRLDDANALFEKQEKSELDAYDNLITSVEKESDSDKLTKLLNQAENYAQELSYLTGTTRYDSITSRYNKVKKNLSSVKLIGFIRMVNECAETESLSERGALLTEAEWEMSSLKSEYTGVKEYDDACKKLKELRASYNQTTQAIQEFKDKVAQCSSNQSLESMFKNIKDAQKMKKELGTIVGSVDYDEACRDLEKAKANYTQLINEINSDHEAATEASMNIGLGFAFSDSLGMVSLIAFILLKLFGKGAL